MFGCRLLKGSKYQLVIKTLECMNKFLGGKEDREEGDRIKNKEKGSKKRKKEKDIWKEGERGRERQ